MRDAYFTSHRTILGGRGGFLAYGWDKSRQTRSQRQSDDLIEEWTAEQDALADDERQVVALNRLFDLTCFSED